MKKNSGTKPIDLRRQNYQTIIQLFRDNSCLIVRDIMEVVSLSKTAITNILNNLIKMDIVHSVGKGLSTNQGGKKPELYSLNPDYRYVITIFFSHEYCLCQLFNINYEVIAESIKYPSSLDGYSYSDIISLVANLILSIMKKENIIEEQLCGIVFHCAGIVLNKEGILSRPILSPHWDNNLHVIEDLRSILPFSIPFYLDNTSRYHGYYELLTHPERRSQNIITIYCENSVGGSQIRMGHLIHGLTGLVGEYGHITTDYSFTERCNCGNYGCFETSVSQEHVIHHICRDLKIHSLSSLNGKKLSTITMDDIFQAANQGDKIAQKHLDFIIQQFSVLIYNMQITYDPDEIIIQGVYSNSKGYFQDNLRQTIRHLSLHSIQSNMKLTFSPTYNSISYKYNINYAMKGAALFCFDEYFKQLDFFI